MTAWYDIVTDVKNELQKNDDIKDYVIAQAFRPIDDKDTIIQVVANGDTPAENFGQLDNKPELVNGEVQIYVQNQDDVQLFINGVCDIVKSVLQNEVFPKYNYAEYLGTSIEYDANESLSVMGEVIIKFEILKD